MQVNYYQMTVRAIIFLTLSLISFAARSQQKKELLDSTFQQIDSVQSELNRLSSVNIPIADSLQNKVNLTDSISKLKRVFNINQAIDTTINGVQNRLEEKSGLKYLNNKRDSITNQLTKTKTSINDSINGILTRFSIDETSEFEGVGEVLPSTIPNAEMIDAPEIDPNLKSIVDLDELEIKEINSVKGSEEFSKIEEVGAISKKIDLITLDSATIAEEVKKEAFEKVKHSSYLDEANEEFMGLDQQQIEIVNQVKQYQDPDFISNQLKDQAMQVSNQAIPINPEVLKAAQSKMSILKKRVHSIERSDSLPKKLPNPLANKSLSERIIIGLQLQVHRNDIYEIDLTPTLGYRIWDDIDIAIGGIYRLNLGEDGLHPQKSMDTYGFRTYGTWHYKRGIYGQLEFERYRMWVPLYNTTDSRKRDWVNGLNIGIGKRSKISRTMRSYIVALYSIGLNEPAKLYKNNLMIRLGVEGLWRGKRYK